MPRSTDSAEAERPLATPPILWVAGSLFALFALVAVLTIVAVSRLVSESVTVRSQRLEVLIYIALSATIALVLVAGALLWRAYAAYRDRAARLAATLDNIGDAIMTVNASGNIESWSKGAERIFGYAQAEILGRNVKVLMPAAAVALHDSEVRRYLAAGEGGIVGSRREREAIRKDGERVPVDLFVNELHINQERLFILFGVDV
jgi:PAS domain S-box-containing protein